jgi:hypothetical protein
MKTIKILSVLTLVAVVGIAAATEKPKMNVIPLGNEKALIAIENEKPAYFELSIESQYGDLVYYKESATELTNLRQVINYAALEKGSYSMKLKVNDTFLKTDFTIDHKSMMVGESRMEYAPYFEFKNNDLKFSYLNFDKENMGIKIINNGEVVFEKKLGKDFIITSGYDLSKLDAGKYQVELTSMNNQFTYDIEK